VGRLKGMQGTYFWHQSVRSDSSQYGCSEVVPCLVVTGKAHTIPECPGTKPQSTDKRTRPFHHPIEH